MRVLGIFTRVRSKLEGTVFFSGFSSPFLHLRFSVSSSQCFRSSGLGDFVFGV